MKRVVLLDVDGVVADCATALWEEAQDILNETLPHPSTWTEYSFRSALQIVGQEKWHLLLAGLRARDDLGYKIGWYPGARDFVEELASKYDVVFVTAPFPSLPHWVEARRKFLSYHPGWDKIDVVNTFAKHRVSGWKLCEDSPEQADANIGRTVILNRPWNAHYVRAPRVNGYADFLKYLEEQE